MPQVKLEVRTMNSIDRLIFREGEDRNGPAMIMNIADKQVMRAAIQGVNTPGDFVFVNDALFRREEGSTTAQIALFTVEQDCDDFIAAHPGTSKITELSGDGFNWKAVEG